jgi:hypothetical protein
MHKKVSGFGFQVKAGVRALMIQELRDSGIEEFKLSEIRSTGFLQSLNP